MSNTVDFTFTNFFSELIFYPSHAIEEDLTKAKVTTVALFIFTLGTVHAVVGLGWALLATAKWIKNIFSSTDQKTQNTVTRPEGLKFDPELRKIDLQNQLKNDYEDRINRYDEYLTRFRNEVNSLKEINKKEVLIYAIKECYKAKYEHALANLNLKYSHAPSLAVNWDDVSKEISKNHDLYEISLSDKDFSKLSYNMQGQQPWNWRFE